MLDQRHPFHDGRRSLHAGGLEALREQMWEQQSVHRGRRQSETHDFMAHQNAENSHQLMAVRVGWGLCKQRVRGSSPRRSTRDMASECENPPNARWVSSFLRPSVQPKSLIPLRRASPGCLLPSPLVVPVRPSGRSHPATLRARDVRRCPSLFECLRALIPSRVLAHNLGSRSNAPHRPAKLYTRARIGIRWLE
jgi:hypothetical protein